MDHDPMKLFGSQRDADVAAAPAPIGDAAPERKSLFRSRGFKRFVSAMVLLIVVAVCVVGYTRANSYGTRIQQARPVEARIEILNPPAWLDRRIVASLLDEAYQFAQRDETTYNRSRNTLDAGILQDYADLYTGGGTAGKGDVVPATEAAASTNRQAVGYNAWIKRVTEVRRDVAKDKSIQTIHIAAEWRMPAAWIRVKEMLYLVDADGTRLPGDYHLEDRPRSRLLAITGIEMPAGQAVPQPGEKWALANGQLGGDFVAGLALVNLLKHQPFATQIDAIDMANFNGRNDAGLPWIVLQTVWVGAEGNAHVVHWGRPIGEEKYYDVQAALKIKTLNELYERFSRIDAGRDYVDVHTEVVRLPKIAAAE